MVYGTSPPRGRDLLDPHFAQHAGVYRVPAFLSEAEIDAIRSEAARHREEHPGKGGTLYLQYNGLHETLEPIVSKIREQVRDIDAEHWGLNAVHELEGVSGVRRVETASKATDEEKGDGAVDAGDAASTCDAGSDDVDSDSDDSIISASFCEKGSMRARTVEFHDYSNAPHGRRVCGTHCDTGSLFTADVMLSPTSDFTGGQFVTTVTTDGGAQHTRHTFEQGDLLVFPSHKPHSVDRVTTGCRRVFVIEFWRGPACKCDARCMGRCEDFA